MKKVAADFGIFFDSCKLNLTRFLYTIFNYSIAPLNESHALSRDFTHCHAESRDVTGCNVTSPDKLHPVTKRD